jgi:hypothetical protein
MASMALHVLTAAERGQHVSHNWGLDDEQVMVEGSEGPDQASHEDDDE